MLVSSIDYNEYVGRIGIGRIERGSMKVGQQVTVCDYHGNTKPYNASWLPCTPSRSWAVSRSRRHRQARSFASPASRA